MNATTAGTPPEALRATMVDHVVNAGHARSGPVEEAMRTVPRHHYVPAATVEEAYANIAVITKRASDGAALSCASVPTVVAMMLDQLDVRPGDRILRLVLEPATTPPSWLTSPGRPGRSPPSTSTRR